VNADDLRRWFGGYLDTLAACGRGERETASLLTYYGVPLLFTTDDGFIALLTEDQVVATAQRQVEGMLASGYHHSEVLGSEVTGLNATSALHCSTFSRHRL
jgi:hypothetical protein